MKTQIRQVNWFSALIIYLESVSGTPFEWGQHDCCLFTCDAIKAMTGVDHSTHYRGKYKTAKGATRVLKKYGDHSVEALVTRLFGEMKPPLSAERGDIALVPTELGDAIGIVVAASIAVVTPSGLCTLPLNVMRGCWHLNDMELS